MADKKRSLRPLETLKKDERETLYKQTHAEVQNYHYESQTIRLLKKEKKQREIEEQLADKIGEYKRKKSELEEFSQKLKSDQKNTYEFINTRKDTIQNLDYKKKQEDEKYLKESEMISQKRLEIKKLVDQKMKVQKELEEIEKKIDSYSIYKSILDEVVLRSEDYEEISHLISRCRTLKKSVNNLNQSYRRLEEETEKEKEGFVKVLNELNEEIGVCTSRIQNLENNIEKLSGDISELQSKQEQQRISRIEHKAHVAKIELSIKNVYSKAMQSKPYRVSADDDHKIQLTANEKKPNEKEEDNEFLVNMLLKIKERYIDLKRINDEVPDDTTSKPVLAPVEEHLKSKITKLSTVGRS